MKKIYKNIAIIICAFCLYLSLSGCFYSNEVSGDGKLSFGVNKMKKDVFCYDCYYDGGDMSFTIPDKFMGYKVTTLGGYTGRGYPCPFSVRIDLNKLYPEGETYGSQEDIENKHPDDEYDILTFTVHLGKNLVNLNRIEGKNYYVRHLEPNSGEYDVDVLCKIVYYFTVDEANPTLYAENGKLYYRKNNKLITDFYYE